MADTTTTDDATDKPKGGKKKLILIGGLALVLLAGGGGAAAWFLGLLGGAPTEVDGAAAPAAHPEKPAADLAAIVFVDMPDVLVNLHSAGQRVRFLKLRAALEVENEAVATQVKTLMPRIMDSFQLYLRALTVDEVGGAGGLQRLKEELTARVNFAIEPARVGDVLVKEMLVQ